MEKLHQSAQTHVCRVVKESRAAAVQCRAESNLRSTSLVGTCGDDARESIDEVY